MKSQSWESKSEEETREIGREIAAMIPEDALIYLSGDLGAGKTLLVRAIATELGADPGDVASPSFNLIHEYPVEGKRSIFHVDGYRLSDDRREWLEIGIEDLIRGPGITFVEWPKRHFDELVRATAEIRIDVEDDESRTIVLDAD
ncbi:MAG: tRNA (adenosine(37)-N6)-threonylcarbamoyltransferase complex ATPase subunit type 1 TsaE [Thermoanaerobaculia bacterium]|nr:tRNA (adenosine(37)-N6)-threonylcarbamoyltransferase complex ATPase subunit type 1 TsaE [Thermoanaerobaculia bacterium]